MVLVASNKTRLSASFCLTPLEPFDRSTRNGTRVQCYLYYYRLKLSIFITTYLVFIYINIDIHSEAIFWPIKNWESASLGGWFFLIVRINLTQSKLETDRKHSLETLMQSNSTDTIEVISLWNAIRREIQRAFDEARIGFVKTFNNCT